MTPERDGDRAPTLSTVLQLDFLEHQRTAEAKIEAASAGLAQAILGDGDLDFAAISALALLDAGLRDLRAAGHERDHGGPSDHDRGSDGTARSKPYRSSG